MTTALDRVSEAAMVPRREPLGSVVIPAHDEASVIGRCLDALFRGLCARRARRRRGLQRVLGRHPGARAVGRHPIRVVEQRAASKPAALRAGDMAATDFPRLYLDADVVLHGCAARGVLERLRAGAIAARPPVRYESGAASAPVRSYYRARSRIPAVLGSLWGAGVYGLSAAGRQRFDAFPDLVADDLWVDRHFDRSEVEIVDCAPVVVTVPRRSRDLVRVLRRTYLGKAEPAPVIDLGDPAPETLGSTTRDLRRLAATGPVAALDAATYAAFAAGARLALAIAPSAGPSLATGRWGRDDSSRVA